MSYNFYVHFQIIFKYQYNHDDDGRVSLQILSYCNILN